MPCDNELKAIKAILNALDARLEVVETKQREMLVRINAILVEAACRDIGVGKCRVMVYGSGWLDVFSMGRKATEIIEDVTNFCRWLKRKVERGDTRKVRDAMKDAREHLCTLDYELVALIADDILKIVHYGVWKSEGQTRYFELFHEGEDDDEIPF